MQSFRKPMRRPVRKVSRKARPLDQRLLREPQMPDLSGLILYGQL